MNEAARDLRSASATHAPLVGVVIATHNYARFIPETLCSLQRQTYTHWECVIVDDGSTDDTAEVVRPFVEADGRIIYVIQSNCGQAAARNNALQIIGGEYVQFLDADDLIEERKLEKQIEFMERHTDVGIVYGGVRYFDADKPGERRHSLDDPDEPWMPGTSGRGENVLMELVSRNILAINSALLRRDVIDLVGLFDETTIVEDWDYFIRCAAAGVNFRFVDPDGTLALVRSHASSASKNLERSIEMHAALRAKIAASDYSRDVISLNREMTARDKGWAGVRLISKGERMRGVRYLVAAGLRSRKARRKAKWFACALLSPFVHPARLAKIARLEADRSPLTTLRKLKTLLLHD